VSPELLKVFGPATCLPPQVIEKAAEWLVDTVLSERRRAKPKRKRGALAMAIEFLVFRNQPSASPLACCGQIMRLGNRTASAPAALHRTILNGLTNSRRCSTTVQCSPGRATASENHLCFWLQAGHACRGCGRAAGRADLPVRGRLRRLRAHSRQDGARRGAVVGRDPQKPILSRASRRKLSIALYSSTAAAFNAFEAARVVSDRCLFRMSSSLLGVRSHGLSSQR